MAMAGGYFSHLGSLMGFIMILNQIVPPHVWFLLELKLKRFVTWLWWETELSIPEYVRNNTNEIYDLVDLYVAHLTDTNTKSSANRIQFTRVKNASKPNCNLTRGERVEDKFKGITFSWVFNVTEPSNRGGFSYFDRSGGTQREYVVQVHRRHKYTLLPEYMREVIKLGESLKRQNQDRQLYTNIANSDDWGYRKKPWRSVPFKHASTFSSLALDPELKNKIVQDLDSFMAGKDFFERVGRAWKRGYLLYGPPGTGKSSLIAAIANYTQYDVYDMELTEVKSNADLRKLLMGISNKAIIVIEDIDCSLELKKRGKPAPEEETSEEPKEKDGALPGKKGMKEEESSRVTLSGLLNFIDGLWSCSGSERIIIFTTNHKEDLDPALLRSGRMDLHILMGYCGFEAFKVLAWTHLEISQKGEFEKEFGEIEELIAKVEITPADIAEVLIQNRGNSRGALEKVIEALQDQAAKKDEEEEGDSKTQQQ
ncbi:AAA-ATPase At4g30250-like [Selaginella moellendorffii]|uniref:AAA-ATPase At4g30250-like n=1 Tax=Selaginella moellendorffii TaxID=88036 RepID=UPI000D1C4D7B|nr:AAA-ATPase At4g30250-like [Selaginella moellendorffii]|eukprot:XP_024524405.1 AAA-ATPase At4g30250-like [Selaginella moellendorffii]